MDHVFYDMFSIINVSFMQLKVYHDHHYEKYELQTGSFPYYIGVLLQEDVRSTSRDLQTFTLHTFIYFLALAFEPLPFSFWFSFLFKLCNSFD